MITQMNHASFTVSDVDSSILFYRDALGLELMDVCARDMAFSETVTGVPRAELRVAYLRAPNCALELIQYLSPEGKRLDTTPCNVGSAHVCFYVDDFPAMMVRLRERGVEFRGVPTLVPAGPNKGRSVVYVMDPDRNTVEFISEQIDAGVGGGDAMEKGSV